MKKTKTHSPFDDDEFTHDSIDTDEITPNTLDGNDEFNQEEETC